MQTSIWRNAAIVVLFLLLSASVVYSNARHYSLTTTPSSKSSSVFSSLSWFHPARAPAHSHSHSPDCPKNYSSAAFLRTNNTEKYPGAALFSQDCADIYTDTEPWPPPEGLPTLKDYFGDGYKITSVKYDNYIRMIRPKYWVRLLFDEDHTMQPPSRVAHESRYHMLKTVHIPDSFIFICARNAFVGDSNIAAGSEDSVDENQITDKFVPEMRFWFSTVLNYESFVPKNELTYIDVPGLVVQLTAWSGAMFNHFFLDTGIRLGTIYDLLMSDDPVWGKAKIVIDLGMDGAKETLGTVKQKFLLWVLEKLELADRILPGVGWMEKSQHMYRAQYALLPEVYPIPQCTGNAQFGPWARDIVRPVQKKLGVFDELAPGEFRNLIIYTGRKGVHRREENPQSREQIHELVQSKIKQHNEQHNCEGGQKLEFFDFKSTKAAEDMKFFRRAIMVMGPHGAANWNTFFCRPGTTVLEFQPIDTMTNRPQSANDLTKDFECRAHFWGMAEAANFEFWAVETAKFDFHENHGGLEPNLDEISTITDLVLSRYKCSDRVDGKDFETEKLF